MSNFQMLTTPSFFLLSMLGIWTNVIITQIMIRIPDERVKKGCSILTILEDGSSCLYKYPPGYLLSPSDSHHQYPISLMENTHSSRTEAGLIAVLCTENPATIEFGAISHEIILCQG